MKRSFLLLAFLCSISSITYSQVEYDSYKIIQKGIKLHDEEKYALAIAEFKKVNKNDTNFVLAMLELANSYIANDQDSLAVQACNKVLFLPSEYAPTVLLYKANALDNMKKPDEAIKVFQEGLKKYPLNNSFYYHLGILKFNQKKYKEANDYYIKSIRINPYDANSHFQMGNIAFLQGKIVPAMLAWSFYLVLDNSSERAKILLTRMEKLAQNEYHWEDSTKIEAFNEEDDFSELDALLKSKIALQAKYKSKIDLNYSLTKQMQLLLEKLAPSDNPGFYTEFYVPIFVNLNKKGYFEPFMYNLLAGVGLEKVNSWLKKNTSDLNSYSQWMIDYINTNKTTFETNMNGKVVPVRHWYNGNWKILSAGMVNAADEPTGYWNYYYPNGILKSEGAFNTKGLRTGTWKFYYPTGLMKSQEIYTEGEVGGNLISYYENGSILINKNYKNNLLDGLQTSYYPTGVKNMAVDYKAGKQEGREIKYYSNGKLQYDVKVVNDKYEGELILYYDNGHVKEKTTMKNGERNGKADLYYNLPENVLKSTGVYVNGIMTGEVKTFHQNGKVETVGKYNKMGEKEGRWLAYYDNDTISEDEVYSNGKLNGTARYYDDRGGLVSEFVYKNDILQSYKAYNGKGKMLFQNEKDGKRNYDLLLYYSNGNKHREGQIVNAKFDGLWLLYDRNGFIRNRTTYSAGVKNGKSIDYYENGKIKNEQTYVNGETDGYYKEYYKNGKLQREGPYVQDKFVGEWKNYYSNGNLESVNFYKDDEKDGWQQYYAVNGKLETEEYIELGYVKKRTDYDSSGNIIKETEFDKGTGPIEVNYFNGKKFYTGKMLNDFIEGTSTFYYPNGTIKETQNYVNGNLQGELKVFYPNGKLQWHKNFVYGKRHGKQLLYDDMGNLDDETNYFYGSRNGKTISYYPNKQPEFVGNYNDDNLEGERFFYDESGELIFQRIYRNGYVVGYSYLDKTGKMLPPVEIKNETALIKAFYKNGNPSIEYTLKKGSLDGKRTVYYPNGKVKLEETYISDEQNGPEKVYYPSGTVKSEEKWDPLESTCRHASLSIL